MPRGAWRPALSPRPPVHRSCIPLQISPDPPHTPQRVKTNIKPEIPSATDKINLLKHVGKQTEVKLLDLREAMRKALESGACNKALEVPEHLNCVDTAGKFQALLVHLQGQHEALRQLLKVGSLPASLLRRSLRACVG